MDYLSLKLLGPFEATLDGQTLTQFRTNKVQALLIYLVVEAPTLHQRDALMALLWPGLPQKSAQVNLRQTLYQLNRMVPAFAGDETDTTEAAENRAISLFISGRKTVELHPDYPVDCDVTRLSTLLQRSWRHSHTDILTCPECRGWLEDAVAHYQGDFLADFSLYDSSSFESWANAKRESLRRQILDTLDILTQVYMTEQAYAQAEQAARHQLTIDNLRENSYRHLMQVLALTGRRNEAIALYEECKRLLLEELGMAPAAKTTALSEQIKGGSLSLITPEQRGIRGYELGEALGEGAFGKVYKATQKGIGREVAIKIIHAHFTNQPQFIRRFEVEAQIVARLEHPHIVPLYDYWREPDGAYLVMRWLRGGSLQQAMREKPFTLPTAVTLINHIASALHSAHRQGIIHRDVKPANILLDEEGHAYLSDFGIARDTAANLDLTHTNEMVGSPAYISPEQLLGEKVNPATDIYCLGLVLYELLMGAKPYETTSVAALIQQQINKPVPLISPKRPDLPAAIDDIIQKATAKKAEDRFETAVAFADALQDLSASSNDQLPIANDQLPIANDQLSIANDQSFDVAQDKLPIAAEDVVNPYKGLHAFQERDAAHFYGRQTLIDQLLTRLAPSSGDLGSDRPVAQSPRRFLAIVGPSGSGKSSVVKAGLIPALRNGALPGSEKWFIVEMTPGSYPLEELEAALMRVAVEPPPSLLEPLQKDERGLMRVLKRLLPQDRDEENPSQLLLVIDQFEELFTLVEKETDRTHFLNNLFTALTEAHSRLWVILTLRADFYDRPLQLSTLGEWLRQRTELVLPLNTAELEEAIVAPAASMGVTLEPGLISAIITDVKEQPGALPLMQYALTELFERRNGRWLTLADYEEIGGVTGALARRADEIYEGLNPAGREAARQLFLRLITLGEGVEDTRRRVLQSELAAIVGERSGLKPSSPQNPSIYAGSTTTNDVLDVYGRYRLLTFDHDPVTRHSTVEVAHEALLREWRRLRAWLEESRHDVRMQRVLANGAREWETAANDASYLLRGSRLDQFKNWVSDSTIALTQDERAFLQASLAAREDRQTAEEARRQRELETAQQLAETERRRAEEQAQSAQTLRRRAIYLGMVALVALVLAVVAGLFSQQASQNETVALENEATAVSAEATAETSALESEQSYGQVLAVQAQQALADGDSELALLLALAANEIDDPPAAVQKTLLDAAFAPGTRRLYRGHDGSVASVAIANDGQSMLSASADNTLILWDIATGDQRHRLTGHEDWVNDVAISADALSALSASSDGSIIWWDLETGAIKQQMRGYRLNAWSVAFHPDNGMALSGGSSIRFLSADGTRERRHDGKLILWDLASGEIIQPFGGGTEGHRGDVWSVAMSPDGRLALAGSDETAEEAITLILWDVESGAPVHRFESMTRAVYDVAISPDGRTGLAASADGNLTYWDLESGALLLTLPGPDDFLVGWALAATYSPDGRTALAAYGSGQLIWWNLETGQPIQQYLGHRDQVRDVAFLPNGVGAVSAGHEGIIRLWDLENQWIIGRLGDDSWQHQAPVSTIEISEDGRLALSGAGQGGPEWPPGGDNDLILWDLETGQPLRRLVGHTADVTDVTFSADGVSAVSSSQDRSVIVWDLENGEISARLVIGGRVQDAVNSVDLHPNGDQLLITRDDPLGVLWDLETQQPIRNFLGHVSQLADMVFVENGDLALSASHDGSLILWEVVTGQPLRTLAGSGELPGHSGSVVYRVAISPDGQTALSAGWDNLVILWDLLSGEPLLRLQGHQGAVTGVAFHPDGQTAVSTAADGSLIVWDLVTGEISSRLTSSRQELVGLSTLAISRDGQTILTGDFNGQINQWRVESPTIPELQVWIPANRIVRPPTCQERDVYRLLPLCETPATPTPMAGAYVPMAIPTAVVTPLSPVGSVTAQSRSPLIAQVGENQGLFSSNRRDVWTYEGQAGEVITIRFVPEREAQTVNLQLLSQTGRLLLSEFNAPIEGFVLPTDGAYRIEVSSSLAQVDDAYTLMIESTLP